MPIIKLNKLRPGMIPSSNVVELNGRTLILSGVKIQEKHLSILKKWGITQIEVYGEDEKESVVTEEERDKYSIPEQISDALLINAIEECSHLFKLNDVNVPLTKEFFRLAVGYTIRNHPDVEPFDVT